MWIAKLEPKARLSGNVDKRALRALEETTMKKALMALSLACTLVDVAVQAEVVERIVAKVNGEIITKTQLDAEFQAVVERLGPAPTPEEEERRLTELRRQVLEGMIDNMLIMQVAKGRDLRVPPRYFQEWKANIMKEMNIDSEDEFQRQLQLQGMTEAVLKKQFEEGLLIQEIRRMEVDSKISMTEPEIDKYYRDHINDYTEAARVRLREIVVRFEEGGEDAAAEKARRLLQDIQQGADFAEVARRHSDANSREAGGDLGFFEKRELAESLADVAFQLAPGDVSDLIRFESSFRIIRVEEKTEDKIMTLDSVRKDISEAIFQEKLQERTERYLRQLREQAIVEIKL
jgi:parvulin-like peptidyl-prolyl isomerase